MFDGYIAEYLNTAMIVMTCKHKILTSKFSNYLGTSENWLTPEAQQTCHQLRYEPFIRRSIFSSLQNEIYRFFTARAVQFFCGGMRERESFLSQVLLASNGILVTVILVIIKLLEYGLEYAKRQEWRLDTAKNFGRRWNG